MMKTPRKRMARCGKAALKIFLAALLLGAAVPVWSESPAPRFLSLEDCVAAALDAHPSLKRARAATAEQAARLERLRADDRPSVEGGASWQRVESSARDGGSASATLALSLKFYDGGKNRLLKTAQKQTLLQYGTDEERVRHSVAGDVKRAYHALLLTGKNLETAREKLGNLTAHLERAQGFYEAGIRPLIDVTKAKADVAGARVDLLKAEADSDLAEEGLRLSMGSSDPAPIVPTTPLTAPAVPNEASVERALRTRPDSRRADLAVDLARTRVRLAARGDAPTLAAEVSSAFSALSGLKSSLVHTLGLRLSIPLSDGGATKAETDGARASASMADAERDATRQKIAHEVRSAERSLKSAVARIDAAAETLRHARETLDLAEARYSVGLGSPIEVSDAVSLLAQARFGHYRALYDARSASDALDEALGQAAPPAPETDRGDVRRVEG